MPAASGLELKVASGTNHDASGLFNARLHPITGIGDFVSPSVEGLVGFQTVTKRIAFTDPASTPALIQVPRTDAGQSETVGAVWTFNPGAGVAPFVTPATLPSVGSTATMVTNLNANYLQGYGIDASANASTIPVRDVAGRMKTATPAASDDAANRGWVESIFSGVTGVKEAVRVKATGNVNLGSVPGASDPVWDGPTLVAGNRVLLPSQTIGSQNGIYVWNASGVGGMTRATDYDSDADVSPGDMVFVSEGTTGGNTRWQLITDDPITLGTTALSFAQIGGGTSLTAGPGLAINGTEVYVKLGTGGAPAGYLYTSGRIVFASGSNTLDGTNGMHWDTANSRLGVGTTTPLSPIEASSVATNGTGGTGWGFTVTDRRTMAAGVGGGMTFRGYTTGTSTLSTLGAISAQKLNGTAGNQDGDLVFWAGQSGVLVERMRIRSTGAIAMPGLSPNLFVVTDASSNLATFNLFATGNTWTATQIFSSTLGIQSADQFWLGVNSSNRRFYFGTHTHFGSAGEFQWRTGDAVTGTLLATLNGNGLGVGAVPSEKVTSGGGMAVLGSANVLNRDGATFSFVSGNTLQIISGNTSLANSSVITFVTGGAGAYTERVRITGDGNMIVGPDISAYGRLDVVTFQTATLAGLGWGMSIRDVTSSAQGVGGGMVLYGNRNGTGDETAFAAIKALKANATVGERSGELGFYANNGTQLELRAKITSTGFLQIPAMTANQMVATDGSDNLVSFNLFGGSHTWTGTNTFNGVVSMTNTIIATGEADAGFPIAGAFVNNLLTNITDIAGTFATSTTGGATVTNGANCYKPSAGRVRAFCDLASTTAGTVVFTFAGHSLDVSGGAIYTPFVILRTVAATAGVTGIKVEFRRSDNTTYETVFDGSPVWSNNVWIGPAYTMVNNPITAVRYTLTIPASQATFQLSELGVWTKNAVPGLNLYGVKNQVNIWAANQTFQDNLGIQSATGFWIGPSSSDKRFQYDTATRVGTGSGNTIIFLTGSTGSGTERARINTTGFGVGTNAPAAQIHSVGTKGALFNTSATVPTTVSAFAGFGAAAVHFYSAQPVLLAVAADGTTFSADVARLEAYRPSSNAYNFLSCVADADGTASTVFRVRGDGVAYTNGFALAMTFSATLVGSLTTYTVTHNLGTTRFLAFLREVATGMIALTGVKATNTSQCEVYFTTAPASGAYELLLVAMPLP